MRKAIQVSIGILLLAWAGFWLANRSEQSDSREGQEPVAVGTPPAVKSGTEAGLPAVFARRTSKPAESPDEPNPTAEEPIPATREPFPEVLNTILTSNDAITNKAQQLYELLPVVSPEEQEEAGRHFINLADDRQFLMASSLLFNKQSSPALVELLMGETLNRPESVKLPVCLAVARQPNHPHAEQAKTVLFLYSDEDFGDNWASWERLVQAKLQEIRENSPADEQN